MSDEATAELLKVAAILPPETRAQLAAACIMVVAADAGIHPRQAAETLAGANEWPTDAEWEVERPRVERLVHNSRAYYKLARFVVEPRRPQG